MQFKSKLPQSGTTIFTVMSKLATDHDAINLGQGFPDFDCDDRLKECISRSLYDSKNQYCPMPGLISLRETLSAKIFHSYNIVVDPVSQICITAGATQAIFTAIMAFVSQGDEVIIFEPAYDSYEPSIIVAGGIPRSYIMTFPHYRINWEVVENMINHRTRMIIINTPHNPTGTIWGESDLIALQKMVADRDIVVLSDEVYEHLIYDGQSHHSVMRYPQLARQSISIYSFGKTLHATGWKIGYCVGPEDLISEFKRIHQWNVFSVNSFIQYALADYLKDPEVYEVLPAFFEKKRDFLTEHLKPLPLKPKISQGTYFQLYDYSEISSLDDLSFCRYLTTEIGVAAIPLSPFYRQASQEKVIRLCFAKKEKTLLEASERLLKLQL